MDPAYLTRYWNSVRAGLLETIDKFRDDELNFRPFSESWSVRQVMLHIAQEERGEFACGIAQTLAEFPGDYLPGAYPTRDSIKSLLESVHTLPLAYLQSLSEEDLKREIVTPWGARYRLVEMIGHMIEHEIHHRAELSLMLGLLGRKGLDA